jgi:signal peptide peptidase SppA
MRYLLRARERLFGRPLLVTPEYANVVVTAVADRLNVEPLVGGETLAKYRRPNDRPVFDRRNGIAVYPIVGSMVHRGDGVEADSGMQSYTAIQRELTELVSDPAVRGILLDLDSPGGEAAGLTELSDWLVEARREKPIWALANTSACSGAYWLGCSASKMYAAPMASVGSIGVVTMHTDVSKAMEKRGVVTTFIYAGKHKIDGHSFGPLPDDVRESVQQHIDSLYGEFVKVVAERRGLDESVVRETEAGVFSPEEALKIGLIDGIGTLGATLKAFENELAVRPMHSATGGKTMTDNTLAITAADVERARVEGEASGAAAARAEIATALASFAGGDERILLFVEGLSDNLSAATAAKFASKVAAPSATTTVDRLEERQRSRTEADVDALMERHAPGVPASDGTDADPKTARLAAIKGSMSFYNASKGYASARA